MGQHGVRRGAAKRNDINNNVLRSDRTGDEPVGRQGAADRVRDIAPPETLWSDHGPADERRARKSAPLYSSPRAARILHQRPRAEAVGHPQCRRPAARPPSAMQRQRERMAEDEAKASSVRRPGDRRQAYRRPIIPGHQVVKRWAKWVVHPNSKVFFLPVESGRIRRESAA